MQYLFAAYLNGALAKERSLGPTENCRFHLAQKNQELCTCHYWVLLFMFAAMVFLSPICMRHFFLGADGDLRGCLVLWSANFGCSTCSGFIALQNYWKSGHARAAEIRKLQLLCARTKLNWFCIKLAIPQQNLHSRACHVRILCICCRLYFKHIRQIANRYKFRSDSFCYANYRATVIRNTCGQSAMARTKCQGLAG